MDNFYYTIPNRVEAARWMADDAAAQARVLGMVLGSGLAEGLTVSIEDRETLKVGDDLTVDHGYWVIVAGGGSAIAAMDDGLFRETYVRDPKGHADGDYDDVEDPGEDEGPDEDEG